MCVSRFIMFGNLARSYADKRALRRMSDMGRKRYWPNCRGGPMPESLGVPASARKPEIRKNCCGARRAKQTRLPQESCCVLRGWLRRRITRRSPECCPGYSNGSSELRDPRAADLPDLLHDICIRSSGTFLHMKAVICRLEPVHGESRRQFLNNLPHQLLLTQFVARPIQAQCRYLDLRQMRVAQFLRLTGGVQGIREQQKSIACEAFCGQHGGSAPSHRVTSKEEALRRKLLPHLLDHSGEALHKARHAIRGAFLFLRIEEVEPYDREAMRAKCGSQILHGRMLHLGARPMSQHQHTARQ